MRLRYAIVLVLSAISLTSCDPPSIQALHEAESYCNTGNPSGDNKTRTSACSDAAAEFDNEYEDTYNVPTALVYYAKACSFVLATKTGEQAIADSEWGSCSSLFDHHDDLTPDERRIATKAANYEIAASMAKKVNYGGDPGALVLYAEGNPNFDRNFVRTNATINCNGIDTWGDIDDCALAKQLGAKLDEAAISRRYQKFLDEKAQQSSGAAQSREDIARARDAAIQRLQATTINSLAALDGASTAAIAFVSAQQSGTMTLPEQQIEAQRLKALCQRNPTVVRLNVEAQSGSMRASYEAAAALIQCYYDNVDPRYPEEQKQQWMQAIQQNKAQADQLR